MTSTAKQSGNHTLAHYNPEHSGPWVAALNDDLALLVRLEASAPEGALDVESLWAVVRAGDGVQSVLDALTAHGLAATPHFAVLAWAHDSVRVFVRGDAVVRLLTDDGEKVLSGAGVSTWLEQTHTSVQRATITDAAEAGIGESGVLLPLVCGVVRTRVVSVSRSGVSPESLRAGVDQPKALSAEHTISLTETIIPVEVQARGASRGVSALAVESAEQSPDGDDFENDESEGFEQLFGATIVHGVQAAGRSLESTSSDEEPAAAPAVAEPKPPAPPRLPTARKQPAAPQSSGATGRTGSSTPTGPSTTQIELPPFITGQNPLAAQPSQVRAGDHDGETIMSDDLRALRRKATRGVASADASDVAAVNYHLRMPNGSVEALTTIVIIGRAPSVSKVSGGKVPRLLSLGNSDQDISRNHVQLELVGDTVVVTDLHSRNGTLVALPGQSPQRLRAGEPTAIVSGSVVDLGGGIAITLGVSE